MQLPLDNPLLRLLMMSPANGLAPQTGNGAFRNVGPNNLLSTPDRNTSSPDELMIYRMFPHLGVFREGD